MNLQSWSACHPAWLNCPRKFSARSLFVLRVNVCYWEGSHFSAYYNRTLHRQRYQRVLPWSPSRPSGLSFHLRCFHFVLANDQCPDFAFFEMYIPTTRRTVIHEVDVYEWTVIRLLRWNEKWQKRIDMLSRTCFDSFHCEHSMFRCPRSCRHAAATSMTWVYGRVVVVLSAYQFLFCSANS